MISFPSQTRDWNKYSEIVKEQTEQLNIFKRQIAEAMERNDITSDYARVGFEVIAAANFYNHAISNLNKWIKDSDLTK